MNTLQTFIQQFPVILPEETLGALLGIFRPMSLEKNTYFAVEGRIETSFGFVESGVLRAFYRTASGKEYNRALLETGEFIGAYSALISGELNRINIQALTPCTLLVADYQQLTALFDQYQVIERLVRHISESYYLFLENRELQIILNTVEERYEFFKQAHPTLENLIPQYHIASYLGITPTQLSRIRAKKF
jgi:CRP-like cAMP-binding protein